MSSSNKKIDFESSLKAVSYTHLRAHETEADLVCRLLLEKKNIASSILFLLLIDLSILSFTSSFT